MFEDPFPLIVIISSGLISGFFVGLASGTAGSFVIPSITIFLGYSIHQAIGTSLVVDAIIGLVAGIIFLKNKNVEIRGTIPIIVTGVIGAFIGSQFTQGTSESGLTILIGIFLILFGLNFIINGIQKNIEYIEKKINFGFFKKHMTVSFIFIGLLLGFLCGFVGMGSGGNIAIVLVFIAGFELHKAIGTSLLTMFVIAGSGAVGHAINNEVIYSVALVAGVCAVGGALLGSVYANKINEDKLGRIIGVVILLLGIFIIVKMMY